MADPRKLEEQRYETIMAHVLHPETTPLPPDMAEQLDRVLTAARLLDRHPDRSQVAAKLQAKYRVGRNTAYRDIRMAAELFKAGHEFDFDFWQAWQIKDLLELIRECKLRGKLKEWANAHKVLKAVIGDRPIQEEDPRRAEKTNVYIQLNKYNVPIEVISKLGKKDLQSLAEAAYREIDEGEAKEIMDS